MKTIESLVKKSGGWKKISKTKLSNFEKRILEEIKNNIETGITEFKNTVDFDFSNIDEFLFNLVEALNKMQNKTPSWNKYSVYNVMPRCVFLKAILYHSETKYAYFTRESCMEDLLHWYNDIDNIFETLITTTKRISSLFTWNLTSEGHSFWADLETALVQTRLKINVLNNFDYSAFVKANPESKKEIKEFCEQA